ncbi:hypothetical protein CDD81_4717 [Ophiocordyceps australis]|uniref:Transcription factor spt8 beta-propeller domain-containing protein n=1 Tax=Ophiocordyceps australis TaxID=1399860 RepID=A0A2C5YA72_9HYPO|nr:hypothetical protein CDD81_4717 [Ophiocordyceps australis]
MDDEDRFSASSGESDRENGGDEGMDEENDHEADEANNDDYDEEEGDTYAEGEDVGDEGTQNTSSGDQSTSQAKMAAGPVPALVSSTSATTASRWPSLRPEALTAKTYDIVPTMAAPQATSINAMAITPDLRYFMTGGSDGYIRKYDGPSTINGKLALTVAQRHPFVDSVTKAGVLMSYWENEEPVGRNSTGGVGGEHEQVLSPVYSLAVHSAALWLLSGLESGGINLQSVRHDEGKKICCLQRHSNAVSVLTLAPDEKSVLSGSWDKAILDWDLNTGLVKRSFDGIGGQISSIELRPASGAPISAEADEPPPASSTMSANNGLRRARGLYSAGDGGLENGGGNGFEEAGPMRDGEPSPAHESLFGGSDAGSLFGETTGEQPFGHDDDNFGSGMDMMGGHEEEQMAMGDLGTAKDSSQFGTNDEFSEKMELDLESSARTGGEAAQGQAVPEPPGAAQPGADEPAQPAPSASQQDSLWPESKEVLKRSTSPSQSGSPQQTSQGYAPAPQQHYDPSQVSATTFLSSAIDGTIRIWDRRVATPVARIGTRAGVPPWCMSAAWSPDGNVVYAGRRNGTVEEFDVRRARRGWEPDRTLKLPGGSGAVSALKPMVNGRHLVCASYDIMRLYDLRDSRSYKHHVPFLVIPGPPRAGVISGLYVDATSRFMLSAAGTRGWEGTCTEVLIGYEITPVQE